jgi:hypothetical protein
MKTMKKFEEPNWKIMFPYGDKTSYINFPHEDWHTIAKILHEIFIANGIKSELTIEYKKKEQ